MSRISLEQFISGCSNPAWVGDGYCDDATNNVQCGFDNGDCCGLNINTQYCQVCQCLGGGDNTTLTPITGGTTTAGVVFLKEVV